MVLELCTAVGWNGDAVERRGPAVCSSGHQRGPCCSHRCLVPCVSSKVWLWSWCPRVPTWSEVRRGLLRSSAPSWFRLKSEVSLAEVSLERVPERKGGPERLVRLGTIVPWRCVEVATFVSVAVMRLRLLFGWNVGRRECGWFAATGVGKFPRALSCVASGLGGTVLGCVPLGLPSR